MRARALGAAVVLALAGWLLYREVSAPAERALPWRDLSSAVGRVEFAVPTQHRFHQEADFAKYLRRLELRADPRQPHVDFQREQVVLAAAGPRSSSGYKAVVLGVAERGGSIVVRAREQGPSLGQGRPGLTYPFLLISMPRSSKPVVVSWQGGT
jgi:hypothetical protein